MSDESHTLFTTRLIAGRLITNGAYVELTGRWEASPAKGQSHELHVTAIENVGLSDAQVGLRKRVCRRASD